MIIRLGLCYWLYWFDGLCLTWLHLLHVLFQVVWNLARPIGQQSSEFHVLQPLGVNSWGLPLSMELAIEVPSRFYGIPHGVCHWISHGVSHGITHRWNPMEPRWNPDGTPMEPRWNLDGTPMGPRWNLDGTSMDPRWNLDGTSILKWNLDGTPMEPRCNKWNRDGT